MTIRCRPITNHQDQIAFDNLIGYCIQYGMSFSSMGESPNGSDAYKLLYKHADMIHSTL